MGGKIESLLGGTACGIPLEEGGELRFVLLGVARLGEGHALCLLPPLSRSGLHAPVSKHPCRTPPAPLSRRWYKNLMETRSKSRRDQSLPGRAKRSCEPALRQAGAQRPRRGARGRPLAAESRASCGRSATRISFVGPARASWAAAGGGGGEEEEEEGGPRGAGQAASGGGRA